MKFFDIHTHIYPDAIAGKAVNNLNAFYSFVCAGKGTADDLIPAEKEAHSAGCLILGVATAPKQVSHVNTFLSLLCRTQTTDSFQVRAFGCIHQDSENIPAIVDDIEKQGLCGVKLHPDIQGVNIDDNRLMPLYECMEGRMPVAFHMGDDREEYRFSTAERLVRIKKRFPKLEVIAAHLGGYRAWQDSTLLADLDGIYFDTSSTLWAMPPSEATRLIHLLGTSRTLFGTDYPVAYPAEELARFDALDLSEAERSAILYNNAARLLAL